MDYNGVPTPINHMAGVSVLEAKMLVIQPWDRSSTRDIEKAILKSELGLTPSSDGKIIRLPIPPLTEERRRDFVKMAKEKGEDAKVAVRGARRDANDRLKKAEASSDITEDELHRGQGEVQKITDASIADIDKVLEAKEKEIMEV